MTASVKLDKGPELNTHMAIIEKNTVVREVALIEAPVDRVWEAFSRLGDWPGWSADLGEPRLVLSEQPRKASAWRKGSVVEFFVRRLGGRTRVRAEVTVSDPPNQVMWTGSRSGIYGQQSFQFEQEGQATRAVVSVAFSGPMLFWVSLALPERRLRKILADWLKGLKSAAETEEQ